MTLIGGYRYIAPSGSSAVSPQHTIVNFMGFPISGLTDSNAVAVCMFKYDSGNKQWIPYT
jgi:hypothetical protein